MIDKEKIPEFPAWLETILNAVSRSLSEGKITASDWAEAKERIKKNVTGNGSRI